MMNVSLTCSTSSWRKRSDEEKRAPQTSILQSTSRMPDSWAGVEKLQNSGEWTALYPVIMELPSFLPEMPGSEKKKEMSKYARQALKLSAKRSNITPRIPEKNRNGAPQPTDGLYWSVSHSNQCVAAVVAPYAIGIDIEQIQDVSTQLKEQIASEAEWGLAPKNDPTLFFRYWTAKEAVLKATGHGLSGLAHCAVTQIIDDVQIRLTYHDTRWLVLQHKISGNRRTGQPSYIAAVTFGGHDIDWQRISMPA